MNPTSSPAPSAVAGPNDDTQQFAETCFTSLGYGDSSLAHKKAVMGQTLERLGLVAMTPDEASGHLNRALQEEHQRVDTPRNKFFRTVTSWLTLVLIAAFVATIVQLVSSLKGNVSPAAPISLFIGALIVIATICKLPATVNPRTICWHVRGVRHCSRKIPERVLREMMQIKRELPVCDFGIWELGDRGMVTLSVHPLDCFLMRFTFEDEAPPTESD